MEAWNVASPRNGTRHACAVCMHEETAYSASRKLVLRITGGIGGRQRSLPWPLRLLMSFEHFRNLVIADQFQSQVSSLSTLRRAPACGAYESTGAARAGSVSRVLSAPPAPSPFVARVAVGLTCGSAVAHPGELSAVPVACAYAASARCVPRVGRERDDRYSTTQRTGHRREIRNRKSVVPP